MRVLTLIFVLLIAALQYPLWLGKGSWLRVWDLNRQIETQKASNAALKARNDTLDAEVRDLKQGYAAIEERARSELGMVKQDEVFYQVLQADGPAMDEKSATSVPSTGYAAGTGIKTQAAPSKALPLPRSEAKKP